jgi:hypothetical protein
LSKAEILRAYLSEPILAGLVLSLLVNVYGSSKNADFMHDEARDILSLLLVLLAASIALWAGLFFITATDFGKWLHLKGMMESINNAYISCSVIFLAGSVLCIVCAHVSAQITKIQIVGEFFCLWSLAVVIPMLNNTRHLLKLHGAYRNAPTIVTELRQSGRG